MNAEIAPSTFTQVQKDLKVKAKSIEGKESFGLGLAGSKPALAPPMSSGLQLPSPQIKT